MQVSPLVAQNIVESMKTIIKQDINFIDTDGTIIASTDPQRVGTYHEGALNVIKSNQILIVSPEDSYQGTRPGINVPVHVNGETIAVIGITGDPQQVTTYGNILRKMTEILVLEDELRALKQRDAERSRMLLEDLIFYSEEFASRWDSSVEEHWRTDNDLKRIIIVKATESAFLVYKEIRHQLEMAFESVSASISKRGALWMEHEQYFVILHKSKAEKIIRRCLDDGIAAVNNGNVAVTVATGSAVYKEFKKSYKDALLALQNGPLRMSEESSPVSFYQYDDLTTELLFDDKNLERQEQLVHNVLAALSPKEIEEFYHIMQLFGKHNGSVSAIAEEMYIHKNTLQYQVQKLRRLTGYDMRRYDDYTVLKMAFTLHKAIELRNQHLGK